MKILDKEHDYYDFACAYIDRSIVYDRRDKDEISLTHVDYNAPVGQRISPAKIGDTVLENNTLVKAATIIHSGIVFVTGTTITKAYISNVSTWRDGKYNHLYYVAATLPEVIAWSQNFEVGLDNKSKHISAADVKLDFFTKDKIREFEEYKINKDDVMQLIELVGSPVFVMYHHYHNLTLYKNALLRNYVGFTDILPAHTAYHSIETALINMQDPSRRMVQLDDDKLAEKHGFGHAYAFRKEPGN